MTEQTPAPVTNKGKNFTLKAMILGLMAFVLILCSFLILGLVRDRSMELNKASFEVHSMWSGPQTIGTPYLELPYKSNCDAKTGKCELHTIYLRPNHFDASAKLQSETRMRGIFEIPQFQGQYSSHFSFAQPSWEDLQINPENVDWSKATLKFEIGDAKGLLEKPKLSFNGQKFELGQMGQNGVLGHRIPSVQALLAGSPLRLEFGVKGSESFDIEALAESNKIKVESDWPHPSFSGDFSPTERTVGEKGFNATWNIMALNHGQSTILFDKSPCLPTSPHYRSENDAPVNSGLVGFEQLQPVNQYVMTERAVKYAVLFIVLTFVLGLFAEGLTGRNIHPLQYLLIGSSLLVFYTLLLALSEQIQFGLAYGVATLAIALQISWFSGKVLRHKGAALCSFGILSSLYGGLYVLLQMEDFALLSGSIALFVILGMLMYLSTKISWLSAKEGASHG